MIIDSLKNILPAEQIQVTDQGNHPLGNDAPLTVYPKTEEEIASVLKMANERLLKVIPVGGGTKRGFGGLTDQADLLLSLAKYKGVIEHSVGDMTIIVRAGTTIQDISSYLAKYNQMLPCDPAWPEQATIGGVIAANDSGPKRLRYGSARDIVLGMKVVYPDGRIIRCGGKTVKNVAGYDMSKLFIGSMGTLGVISTITLKLRPLPKYESLVFVTFSKGDIEEIRSFVIRMLDSHMEPISLELLSPRLTEKMGLAKNYALAIAFEDRKQSVTYQEDWVRAHLPLGAEMEVISEVEAKKWWFSFANLAHYNVQQAKEDTNIVEAKTEDLATESVTEMAIKIGSKSIEVPQLVEVCHQLGEKLQVRVYAHGGTGHGITRAYLKGHPAQLALFIRHIRSTIEEKRGYVIIQHAPLHWRKELGVWGEQPAYFFLFERIKESFDPKRILNHKRFIGGL